MLRVLLFRHKMCTAPHAQRARVVRAHTIELLQEGRGSRPRLGPPVRPYSLCASGQDAPGVVREPCGGAGVGVGASARAAPSCGRHPCGPALPQAQKTRHTHHAPAHLTSSPYCAVATPLRRALPVTSRTACDTLQQALQLPPWLLGPASRPCPGSAGPAQGLQGSAGAARSS